MPEQLNRDVRNLTTSVDRVERRMRRGHVLVGMVLVVVVVVGSGVVLWNRWQIDRATTQLRQAIEVDCPQHRALAQSQVQPWSTQIARDIVEYNRESYEVKCLGRPGYGPLDPPDPDLARPIQPSPTPRSAPSR